MFVEVNTSTDPTYLKLEEYYSTLAYLARNEIVLY